MQVPATPRGLPNPGAPPVPQKTLSRWTLFLGELAVGTPLADAMLKHYMTRADIESCVRSAPEERARWNDARLAARKRAWSAFDIEDILGRIAAGTPITEAVDEVRPGGSAEFTYLCTADPDLHEQYLRALKSRAILLGEDTLKISDGDGDDVLDNGKGGQIPNGAKVNRDKLRVETRTRLMSNWFPKLFGEKAQTNVAVQIVNHAARLEEARGRAASRSATPRISQDIVEAAFREVPSREVPESPVEWDDLPKGAAISTQWLEGN